MRLPGGALVERVEQAQHVHVFAGLQLQAGQHHQARAGRGLLHRRHVGAGIVVGDRQQAYPARQGRAHDERRDHLHLGARREHRVRVQLHDVVGQHVPLHVRPAVLG